MNGRRLWFVGIGGAGLCAYAQLARAWGAEVGGWDRVRTPYLEPLGDVPVEISPEPHVPDGWEAVVSSAYPDVAGTAPQGVPARARRRAAVDRRRRLARQGDDGGDDRVRPARDGPRPGLADRRAGAAARFERRLRQRLPRRRGGRVGPHRLRAARRRSRSSRTSSSTTTPSSRRAAELEREFERWLATSRTSCATRRRTTASSRCPASTTALNAGAALAALELAGVSRDEAAPALARFTGTGRRFEVHESGRARSSTTTATIRPRSPRRSPRARALPGPPRARALPAAPLLAHAASRAASSPAALAAADDVTVTDIYPAREAPIAGRDRQAHRRRALRPRCARRLDADGRAGRRAARPPWPRRRRAARPRRGRRRPRRRDAAA